MRAFLTNKMKVLLFGIQGSGKSTIGKYIAKKIGVPFISIGDIFRQLREENSETGRLVKSLIDKGHFVPDELAMQILNQRLDQADVEKGFVLDGAPRNIEQEKLFKHSLDLIILVTLEEAEAIRRLMSRGRHDDSEDAIRKRLNWHKENTEPLINYFKGRGIKIVEIDNTPDEETVRKGIDELLKN